MSIQTGNTLPNAKQKRKRKTRSVAAEEQGEYLEKMSVRGLDIQSVLDEVQNADSINLGKYAYSSATEHYTTHTCTAPNTTSAASATRLQQQLPSLEFSGMILPGGAQLALANP
ncbi:hypothetical protein EVAR_72441_1, partial [Eumeta japonica]